MALTGIRQRVRLYDSDIIYDRADSPASGMFTTLDVPIGVKRADMVTAEWHRLSTLWSLRLRQLSSSLPSVHQFSGKVHRPKSKNTFSTTSWQWAGKKFQPSPKAVKPPSKTSKPAAFPTTGTYKPFAVALAQRPSSTLLYQGSPQRFYLVGCYGVGIACLLWAGNYYLILRNHPPKGFGSVTRYILSVSYIIVFGFGFFFLLKVSVLKS